MEQEEQGTKKRKKGKLKWILIAVVAVIIIAAIAGGGDSDEPKKTGEVTTEKTAMQKENDDMSETDNKQEDSEEETTEETKTSFQVGDIVETSDLKISYISAEEYTSTNEFIQPKDGYVYYRMEFEFENIGDTDQTISSIISWNCYADGYAMEASYVGDDVLDATISPGKKATGAVYYEVPSDAKDITLEYEVDAWSGDKVEFIVK